MNKFKIGDPVKTTPQWDSIKIKGFEPKNGIAIHIDNRYRCVVFEPPEGGKETMSADWLMLDNE